MALYVLKSKLGQKDTALDKNVVFEAKLPIFSSSVNKKMNKYRKWNLLFYKKNLEIKKWLIKVITKWYNLPDPNALYYPQLIPNV